jgi:hypothetical protein
MGMGTYRGIGRTWIGTGTAEGLWRPSDNPIITKGL